MSVFIRALAITATSTAAPLSATDLWVADLKIQNIDSANPVYIGDSAVADTSGYKLLKTENMSVSALMAPTHVGNRRINLKNVYAVCSAAQTATLRVLYTALVDV